MHRLCVNNISVVVVVVVVVVIIVVIVFIEVWCLEWFLMFRSFKHALSIYLWAFVCSPVVGLWDYILK